MQTPNRMLAQYFQDAWATQNKSRPTPTGSYSDGEMEDWSVKTPLQKLFDGDWDVPEHPMPMRTPRTVNRRKRLHKEIRGESMQRPPRHQRGRSITIHRAEERSPSAGRRTPLTARLRNTFSTAEISSIDWLMSNNGEETRKRLALGSKSRGTPDAGISITDGTTTLRYITSYRFTNFQKCCLS